MGLWQSDVMSVPTSPLGQTRIVQAVCPHDCPDTCALHVTVTDGRVTRVAGDPEHPTTHGALCTKVSRYAERTYHPERVLRPLKRIGRKGEGRFEPVGWDEALDDIAARLKAIAARDPQAILPYSYAGTMGLVQGEGMAARFWNRLGASFLDRTICSNAGGEALAATYGNKVGMHVEFFPESRLILIWGSNPITSSVHFWNYAQQAKRAGARLICIDPRRSETADKCHQHIALLPGTDGALALALMHELITHDWLDHDYIERCVDGFEKLRERALGWTPERAAAVCGIEAEVIRALAREYAGTKPAAIRLNYGMQRVRGGGNAVRLIALLPCLVGAWRHRAGGMLLSSSGYFAAARRDAWLRRPDLLQHVYGASGSSHKGPRTINMVTIGDDLVRDSSPEFGPRIEAVVVYNSNPLAVAPESAKVARAFQREDLFTVVLEHFLTDTADHADYVLPATTQLEHWDAHGTYGHIYAMLNRPAIPPVGEARSNAEIFRQLAARFGFDDACFSDSDETMALGAFDPSRVQLSELVRKGYSRLQIADAPFAEGFPSANGKAIVDAPGLGVPDYVPNYESAQSTPALAADYPLAMISPPARNFLNSSFVNVTSLRAAEGEPVLEMHAADAAARGIADGDLVRIYNARGATLARAVVDAGRARTGVVNGLGVWWRKFGRDGTNVNEVTHQRLTDIGRAPAFYDCLVQVERAAPSSSLAAGASAEASAAAAD
jgi:anaerobic selenocysteine-containing dehydrogenase